MNPQEIANVCLYLTRKLDLTDNEKATVLGYFAVGLYGLRDGSVGMSTPPAQLPKTTTPAGKLIAQTGEACVCNKCRKAAYTVISPVYSEGLKAEDFVACYQPALPLPLDLLSDDSGSLLVDCPLCHGVKAVKIVDKEGKK